MAALVVAAIDFGTTYLSYGFSFRHDQEKIYTSTFGGKFQKERVPTTVLLKPDKTLHSIGYTAEDKYTELAEIDRHKNWFYFKRFKMSLYTRDKLSRDVEICDSEGRPMAALNLFSIVIRYITKCAKDGIRDTSHCINEDDILWVLTVPAIWSDSAKQFMREAAIKAGIAERKLKLVLEPEAASLFCTEIHSLTSTNSKPVYEFTEGDKYILADLGGGTTDVCVHEIVEKGRVRELFRATGDALGGTNVDMHLENFFILYAGGDAWVEFKRNYMDEYLYLMRSFETKKMRFSSENDDSDTTLILPNGLIATTNHFNNKSLKDIVTERCIDQWVTVSLLRNRIRFKSKVIQELFDPVIDGIINLLKQIVNETRCDDVKTMLFVGGFSESIYLRERVKAEFQEFRIVFPAEGSLAVLKGAVLMGYSPRTISERRARYTYGFCTNIKFEEGVHPEYLRFRHDDTDWCEDIFDKQIEKGQVLHCGQVIALGGNNSCGSQEEKHETLYVWLYKSVNLNPKFCTEEEGCSLVGYVECKPPKSGWPDNWDIEIHLIVGETEFTVKSFNKTTGDEYEAKMDFL